MKILQEGTPVTAVATCSHCGCRMEYTNKDMRKDYDNDINLVACHVRRGLYIECPCCGEHITVSKL